MFTGIIEQQAEVVNIAKNQLTVRRPHTFEDLRIGSSICVSGACLSVITMTDEKCVFDVVNETWEKTALKQLQEGDTVNLERAMPASGRFEGHIVQGHVEAVGIVTDVLQQEGQVLLQFSIPDTLQQYVVPKGSIALDGVSLTIVDCQDGQCSVALIPHTCATTTLGTKNAGDSLNIETDILGRYVRMQLL